MKPFDPVTTFLTFTDLWPYGDNKRKKTESAPSYISQNSFLTVIDPSTTFTRDHSCVFVQMVHNPSYQGFANRQTLSVIKTNIEKRSELLTLVALTIFDVVLAEIKRETL